MSYIIKTVIDRNNYFLRIFQGKNKAYSEWTGLIQNATKYKDQKEAVDVAYAETTLECDIIPYIHD